MGTDRRKGADRRTKKRRPASYYQEQKAKKARLSEDTASSATEASTSASGQVDLQPSPSTTTTTTTTTSATPLSASERKLNFMLQEMSVDSEDDSEHKDPSTSKCTTTQSECTSSSSKPVAPFGFRLIDIDILSKAISDQLSCKVCQGDVFMKEVARTGLHSDFVFTCKNLKCKAKKTTFSSSSTSKTNNLEHCAVNRRVAFAMRTIGCDRAELEKFCGVMDLPPPVHKSSYACINESIATAAEAVQAESMTNAAKEEWELAEPGATLVRDIDASGGKFFCFCFFLSFIFI